MAEEADTWIKGKASEVDLEGMEWIAFAALLIGFGSLWQHWRVHLWQKRHQAELREERAKMREEQAKISEIYTEWDEPDRPRLYAKVVNNGDYPLYIAQVTVNGPSLDSPEGVPLFATPLDSADEAIPPNGAARIYQYPITDDGDFEDDGIPTLYNSALKGASVIVESNCGEIARKQIPADIIPARCSRELDDLGN